MARRTGLEQLRSDRETAWQARQQAMRILHDARVEVQRLQRLRKQYMAVRKDLLDAMSSILHALALQLKRAHENRQAALRVFVARKQVFDAACRRLADRETIVRIVRDYPLLLAAVPEKYGYNVKIRPAQAGAKNIYFGGIGEPDGRRHGHYVVRFDGTVLYQRDPGRPHGAHNYR